MKLHRSVANTLRQRLKEGILAEGAKLPSHREMAEEFGVSTMTVRQAIGLLEKEGRLYRVPSAGTFVSPPKHGMRKTEQIVSYASVDLSSPFDMEIARGIEKACQQRGWGIQIFDAYSDAKVEASNIERLTRGDSQGAIIMPTTNPDNFEALYKLSQDEYPFVLVDRTIFGLNADLVESNHELGAYMATEYLLKKGHKKIIVMSPTTQTMLPVLARLRGYERALRDEGIEPIPEWKVWLAESPKVEDRDKDGWIDGYKGILPALKNNNPPLAIFTIDAYAGWGVYQACRELNLRIPEDISIVSFDNFSFTRAMAPPMTVIAQQAGEIGRTAVEVLEQRLRSDNDKDGLRRFYTHIVLDVSLIERESVATLSRT